MAKRVNKSMVGALTAFAFVIMTVAGVLMILKLREVDPQQFVTLAEQYAKDGSWPDAKLYYEKAYSVSKDEKYLVDAGQMLYNAGDETRAAAVWQKAVTLDPQLLPALRKLLEYFQEVARAFPSIGSWRQVKEMAETLLEQDGQNPFGLMCRGQALLVLREEDPANLEEGFQALRRAVEIAPENVEYCLTLAMAEARQNRSDVSEDLFKRLIETNTAGQDASIIRSSYGQFLSEQAARAAARGSGREAEQLRERALASFNEAIALAGDEPVDQAAARVYLARDLLGRELAGLLDNPAQKARADEVTERIRTLLREAIDIDPDGFDQYLLLVELYRALGNRDKAIEVCEQRLQRDIDRKGIKGLERKRGLFTLLNRGATECAIAAAELSAGSPEREAMLVKAEQFVRDAKAELPNDPEAIHTEGRILLVRGKDLEALSKFEEADRAFGGPHWQNKLYLANLYLLQNEVGAARQAIEVAIRQPQATLAVWLTYAQVLLAANEPRQAAEAAQHVLDVNPTDRKALLLQADAYRELDRHDLVQQVIEKLEEDPKNVLIKAKALEAEERFEEALAIVGPLLEADPGNQALVAHVVRLERRLGRLDEAKAVVQRAIAASPDDAALKKLAVTLDEELTPEERDQQLLGVYSDIEDAYVQAWELARLHMANEDWEKAEAELSKAERLLRDGGTAQAVEASRRLGTAALRDLVDRHFLVVCSQKRWDVAEQIAAQAAAENLDGADGLTYYGRLHLFQDRSEQAAAAFQQAVEKHESSPTLGLLGQAYLELQRPDQARAAFERAIELNPNSGPAHKGLAILAKERKDVAAFATHFHECERLMPEDSWVKNAQSELDLLEHPEKAVASLEATLAANPDDLKSLLEIAPLYVKTQQRDKAGECYEKALKVASDSLAVAQQAVNFYLGTDRPDRAREILENLQTMISEPPRQAAALLMLADFYAQQNQLERADATYLAAADKHQGLEICRAIGRHFFSTERPALAVPWLEKAVAQAKEAGDSRLQMFDSMRVEALLQTRDYDRATEGVQHLLADYPAAGNSALMFRAEIEAARGQIDQAVKSLSQFLEGQPGQPLALFRRARYQALQGKWGLAAADLELLKARAPDALGFEPRKWLAQAYERTGRPDQAAAELEGLMEQYPNDVRFADLLVTLHLKHKAFDQADRITQRVLNRRADDSYWLFRRGQIAAERAESEPEGSAERTRHTQKALEDLSRAAQMAGYPPQIVVPLLNTCRRLGNYDRGIELYDAAVPAEQRLPAVIRSYAGLLAKKGLTGKALEQYRLAADAGRQDGALFVQGVVKDAVDIVGAQRAAEMLRTPPDDQRLARINQVLLATTLPLAGQYSDAASLFDQLLSTAQDDQEKVMLHLLFGTAADHGKDYEKAKRNYEEVIRLEPANWVAANNLAYMLCDYLKQCAEARPYAERAMALVPENHVVADTLATVLTGLGEERNAIGILVRALEREPTFVTGHIHLADAYRRLGQFAEAQAQLEEAQQLIDANPADQSAESGEKVKALLDRVHSKDSSP